MTAKTKKRFPNAVAVTARLLEVWKVLCVSTAHLTEPERASLDFRATYMHREGYGAVLWIGEPGNTPDLSVWSESARAIFKIAHETGCAYVAFDADADIIGGVPTHE
jgi:hypothetical protein